MKILRPKKINEFFNIFDTLTNSGFDYYRGQANVQWDIVPGIARNKKILEFILDVEKKLNSKFEAKINENELSNLIPILKNSYHESWQRLMAAQHYGLPTRFIDFTLNKYVALEFAITDPKYLDNDSTFIIYKNADEKQVNDETFFKEPFPDINESFFLQAPINKESEGNDYKLSEIRKSIQGSKFFYRGTNNLFCCLTLDKDHSKSLIKIEISRKLKQLISEYFIKERKIIFDPYSGKNAVDYFSAVLKNEFSKLNERNIGKYLKT